MTEMFGEAWSPMSVPDLAPDDDDDLYHNAYCWKLWSPTCTQFRVMAVRPRKCLVGTIRVIEFARIVDRVLVGGLAKIINGIYNVHNHRTVYALRAKKFLEKSLDSIVVYSPESHFQLCS